LNAVGELHVGGPRRTSVGFNQPLFDRTATVRPVVDPVWI